MQISTVLSVWYGEIAWLEITNGGSVTDCSLSGPCTNSSESSMLSSTWNMRISQIFILFNSRRFLQRRTSYLMEILNFAEENFGKQYVQWRHHELSLPQLRQTARQSFVEKCLNQSTNQSFHQLNANKTLGLLSLLSFFSSVLFLDFI